MYGTIRPNIKMAPKGRVSEYTEWVRLPKCGVQYRCVSRIIIHTGSRRSKKFLIFLRLGVERNIRYDIILDT
jgi:hypothetical protein